ncbi:putative 50S ribosomal protein-related [Melia azedarach]|uniref:50S ribosomal protein-related n=1 Tax=Melia azedarach TaxID=155640 RepID=A0ACC1X6N6_MELAZ|nr:putative 50S ribosomal protein-related [Melia azedarach]
MATLQKFKLLATQCAVSGSPTRSPTASPVIHLRRRKTLRMLLNRRRLSRRDDDDLDREITEQSSEIKNKKIRAKLKDLFVSSPPFEEKDSQTEEDREGLLPMTGSAGSGSSTRRGSAGSLRPVSATFRYRLLRRAWRPVLVTIPE